MKFIFKSARIKLTVWYVMIIFVIVTFFSFITYNALVDSAEHALMKQQRRLMRVGFMYDKDNNWYLRNYLEKDANIEKFLNQKIFDIETLEDIKSEVALRIIIVDGVILFASGILSYLLAGVTLRPISKMVEDQKKFFSDAAHELRTPLTIMKSNTDIVLMNKGAKKNDFVDVLKDNLVEIKNMQDLTDGLLKEQMLLNSTKNETALETFDVYMLTKDLLKKFETTAKKHHTEIKLSGNTVKIKAIKLKIKELLSILIDNSIKYSKPKDGAVNIKIYKKRNFAFVKIKDNGTGIEKDDLDKVFNRFYRVDSSRSKNIKGFGLGLSIAKSIVDSHGGDINIESKKNVGTIVTVKLPISL